MLTGFGLVLYSRLHLITNNCSLLRWLLGMIVVIAFAGHTMSFVQLVVISANKLDISSRIVHAISWLHVIFTLQDLTLSVTYIYLYWKHINDSKAFATEHAKKRDTATFKFLIAANSLVLFLDIIHNVLLCSNVYLPRYMAFPLICSIKLELEFFVLNRLVKRAEKASQNLQAGQFADDTSTAISKIAGLDEQERSVVCMQRLDFNASMVDDGLGPEEQGRGTVEKITSTPNRDRPDYDSKQFVTQV